MTKEQFSSSAFVELRNRMKALHEDTSKGEDSNLDEVLRHLVAIPEAEHTTESAEALLYLARNFQDAGEPGKELQAASYAARCAAAWNNKSLLCAARGAEGTALDYLGRFAEASGALVDSWLLARETGDTRREIQAVGNFGNLCVGMGQWNVALRYFQRSLDLSIQYGFADYAYQSRVYIAICAMHLRQPALGLHVLSQFGLDMPNIRHSVGVRASAHITFARLYLLLDDWKAAQVHAKESVRLCSDARLSRQLRTAEAVLGLADVRSGAVGKGLAALEEVLTTARRIDHTEVPDLLSMCVEACEAAYDSERALKYLEELVAWKKRSFDVEAMPLNPDDIDEVVEFQPTSALADDVLSRAELLQANMHARVERLLDLAINAELSSGHNLYRTFRVADLSRQVGAALGWAEKRLAGLALGARLSNIGMTAVPARVLLKPSKLSLVERRVMEQHPRYGSDLLRRAKLQMLEPAIVIAAQHHEHYDGHGYPAGIAGDAISEEARIVAICDAFDAMTRPRPWRLAPLSFNAALGELRYGAGGQFDPRIVKVFVTLFEDKLSYHENLDQFLTEEANHLGYVRARAQMESLVQVADV